VTPESGGKTVQDELVEALMGEAFAEDASPKDKTLAEHDKEKHPQGFNPKTDTCKFRDRLSKETEADKADIENPKYAPQGDSESGAQPHSPKRMGIPRIFTGSAANYDKPSLLKVGTGEGAQVYGWGLYGSSEEGVALKYATADYISKRRELEYLIEGKHTYENKNEQEAFDQIRSALSGGCSLQEIRKNLEEVRDNGYEGLIDEVKDIVNKALALINSQKADTKQLSRNIYEQTFFTNREEGDESHLLRWYEPITEEQFKWIRSAIESQYNFEPMEKQQFRMDLAKSTGEEAYELVKHILEKKGGIHNSPKATSEFLTKNCDIDGVKYPADSYGGKTVKDGDIAGWNYVSFRDDNMRIDKKYVDGLKVYDYQELMEMNHPNLNPFEVLVRLTRLDTAEEMAIEFARIMEENNIQQNHTKTTQDELVDEKHSDSFERIKLIIEQNHPNVDVQELINKLVMLKNSAEMEKEIKRLLEYS
jgi:hypothetical protein